LPKRLKFILTVDAQKLAKWLRLLGYDTKVIKAISLLNLIRMAQTEERVIVSRSKEVLNHPLNFDRIFIHSNSLDQQLQEMKPFLEYEEEYIFLRCPEDNDLLYSISKEKVLALIPEKVGQLHDDFKICHKCGRVYWQGSHYHKIKQKLELIFNPNNAVEF